MKKKEGEGGEEELEIKICYFRIEDSYRKGIKLPDYYGNITSDSPDIIVDILDTAEVISPLCFPLLSSRLSSLSPHLFPDPLVSFYCANFCISSF